MNTVTDVPQAFTDWVRDNSDRISRAKSLPYFIRDNKAVVDGILNTPMETTRPYSPLKLTAEQKTYRKELQRKAIEHFKGVKVRNVFDIAITTNGIKEFLNQPHKHYFEKNELVLELDRVLESAVYLGENTAYNKSGVVSSQIYETTIGSEKSWLVVRIHTDGSVSLHSVSDNPKIAENLKKP